MLCETTPLPISLLRGPQTGTDWLWRPLPDCNGSSVSINKEFGILFD